MACARPENWQHGDVDLVIGEKGLGRLCCATCNSGRHTRRSGGHPSGMSNCCTPAVQVLLKAADRTDAICVADSTRVSYSYEPGAAAAVE